MSDHNKKILIVSDFYKPHLSGMTFYIDQQVKTLLENNYKVTILTINYTNNLNSEENQKNLRILRVQPSFKFSRGLFSLELIKLFIKESAKHHYIHIHYPIAEIFLLILFFNKKVIFNYHCIPSFNQKHLMFVKFYFYFFSLISILLSYKTIVLSKDYFKNTKLNNFFLKKVVEISPYISFQPNNLLSAKNKDNVFTIGYLGRLSYEKSLETLIKASEILEEKKVDHRILIAGDDKDQRFIKYISKIKLKSKNNNNISFLGKISEKSKEKFYKLLDVFVLPSNNSFEAFGIVQLEAMNYGLPVIASNLPGVKTIITNTKNGFLFEINNSKELANKLIKIKYNYKLKKEMIIRRVNEKYNKSKFDKSFLDLFKD